jgi:membrane protease YdiL (CAAX protease family)
MTAVATTQPRRIHDLITLTSCAVLMMYGIAILGRLLAPWIGASSHGISISAGATPITTKLAIAAMLLIISPIIEEITFRGSMLLAVRHWRVPAFMAAAVSAVAWALIHWPYSGQSLLTYLGLGLVLAWLALRTGRIMPCIVAHAAYNAVPAGVVLLYLR